VDSVPWETQCGGSGGEGTSGRGARWLRLPGEGFVGMSAWRPTDRGDVKIVVTLNAHPDGIGGKHPELAPVLVGEASQVPEAPTHCHLAHRHAAKAP
jgi:hypothetical protein